MTNDQIDELRAQRGRDSREKPTSLVDWKKREELRDKIANKLTDDCPIEALMQHFYMDQVAWLEDLSDEDLLEQEQKVLNGK
jgi:hypothetical protein